MNDDIIKINGKTAVFDKDLASYHKHEAISAEEVSQILSFERIKNRVLQTNEPILKIFEQEEIAMAKAGKSTKEKADGLFQYESKKIYYSILICTKIQYQVSVFCLLTVSKRISGSLFFVLIFSSKFWALVQK